MTDEVEPFKMMPTHDRESGKSLTKKICNSFGYRLNYGLKEYLQS